MDEFHDLDPSRPYAVDGEVHIIRDGRVRLNHAPLKGSVHIEGYEEQEHPGNIPAHGFWVDYQDGTGYRTATQMVYFSLSADGQEITVDYHGVGTLFLAEHANAFRMFMLSGAREQAVEEIAKYDDRVSMAVKSAADSIKEAIGKIALQCSCSQKTEAIATNEDIQNIVDGLYTEKDGVSESMPSSGDDDDVIATSEDIQNIIDGLYHEGR